MSSILTNGSDRGGHAKIQDWYKDSGKRVESIWSHTFFFVIIETAVEDMNSSHAMIGIPQT